MAGLHRGRDGHQCCGVSGNIRETGLLGEERALKGFLELLIVEGQERRRTSLWHQWDSVHDNREVSDDVACDFSTLIQYLLAIPTIMCGITARSAS